MKITQSIWIDIDYIKDSFKDLGFKFNSKEWSKVVYILKQSIYRPDDNSIKVK